MSNFWNNISRYPRFLISSLVGSLLVILTPIKTFFRFPQLRGFFVVVIFLILITIYSVIRKMAGL